MKRIRLSESDLHRVIAESVKGILNEDYGTARKSTHAYDEREYKEPGDYSSANLHANFQKMNSLITEFRDIFERTLFRNRHQQFDINPRNSPDYVDKCDKAIRFLMSAVDFNSPLFMSAANQLNNPWGIEGVTDTSHSNVVGRKGRR